MKNITIPLSVLSSLTLKMKGELLDFLYELEADGRTHHCVVSCAVSVALAWIAEANGICAYVDADPYNGQSLVSLVKEGNRD